MPKLEKLGWFSVYFVVYNEINLYIPSHLTNYITPCINFSAISSDEPFCFFFLCWLLDCFYNFPDRLFAGLKLREIV